MKDRLYVTRADFDRLRHLIESRQVTVFEMEYLELLEEKLDRAEVVEPEAIPPDIVTLNSEVLLKDLDSGGVKIYRLVLPAQGRMQKSISILTPLGIAMLGYKVGEIIEFPVPRSIRRLKVLDVLLQPETAVACCV